MRIIRRLGATPAERGSLGNVSCPDLFLLDGGDVAAIGTDATDDPRMRDALARAGYPPLPPGTTVVILTRDTLTRAAADIAAETAGEP